MELQWNKRSCPYLQTHVRQVQSQEQTQELRLPEELPDIGRVLCAWGQPVLRNKEWRGDGMSASGGVSASVLYLPEDGSGPKVLETWIPFQAKWSFAQTRREGIMRIKCILRALDARTLSARKMMLRASIAVFGEALEPTEADVYTPDETPETVEILSNVYPAVLPKEAGEKQFFFEEEINIPNVAKWISFSFQPELTEQNVVGSRAVIRGIGKLHYVYMDEAGTIQSGDQQLPFAQFADLDHDYGKDATVDVIPAVSSLEPELTADGVKIQCGIAAQYLLWDRELLEMTEDAYSNHYDLSNVQETLTVPTQLDDRNETVDIDHQLPEGNLLDMVFRTDFPTSYREGDMINLEIPGTFQYLYQDVDGNLQSAVENVSAAVEYPAAEGCQLMVTVSGADISEHNAHIQLRMQTGTNQEFTMICGISMGDARKPDPSRPSLILRRMDSDSLWELAKANGSTMDAIRKANQLTQDPDRGQMLLIPVS